MIAKEAEGFLYLVSSLGVTGMRNEINTDLESIVRIIRTYTKIPCAIGFGISTPEQAKKMAGVVDGVIVGSALVHTLLDDSARTPKPLDEGLSALAAKTEELAEGIHNARH